MKNIIFDVGDVLLEYRWKDMLVQDYGMTEERAVQIESRCLTIRSGVVWILETHWKKQFADTRKSIRNMQKKSVGF